MNASEFIENLKRNVSLLLKDLNHKQITEKDDLFFFSDSISESNPRVIDDSRARKLATDLKHCSYYETCATYGLNVERVFQEGQDK